MFCQYGRQVSHAAQHGQAVNLRALFGQVVDITNGPETRRVYAVAHHGGMAPGPEYHQIAHQGLSLQTSGSVRYLAIPTVRRPCCRNWPFRYLPASANLRKRPVLLRAKPEKRRIIRCLSAFAPSKRDFPLTLTSAGPLEGKEGVRKC